MAKKKKKRTKRSLGWNAHSWALDRAENGEPLWYNRYLAFMKELGNTNDVAKAKQPAFKRLMERVYKDTKALIRKQEKMDMRSIRR